MRAEDGRLRSASGHRSLLRRYAECAFLAGLFALVLRAVVAQGYKIPSSSMVPTLLAGDHVLVSKLHYGLRGPVGGGWILRYRSPRPGDIIVFVGPSDGAKPTVGRQDFVKRVVAVAGELVELRGGEVLVEGRPREVMVTAPNGSGGGRTARFRDFGPRRVPDNQLFVLGDNRADSRDSRDWGFVGLDEVEGRASLIFWSWDSTERAVRWDRIIRRVN